MKDPLLRAMGWEWIGPWEYVSWCRTWRRKMRCEPKPGIFVIRYADFPLQERQLIRNWGTGGVVNA